MRHAKKRDRPITHESCLIESERVVERVVHIHPTIDITLNSDQNTSVSRDWIAGGIRTFAPPSLLPSYVAVGR